MADWAQLIVSNIFVAALIGGLAWLVGRSGQRAQLAHLLWVAFFLKLVTPPIILLPIEVPAEWLPDRLAKSNAAVPSYDVSPSGFAGNATLSATDGNLPATNVTPRYASAWQHVNLWNSLGFFWFAGFASLIGRGTIKYWRFHRLLKQEGIVDAEATSFVGDLIQAQYPNRRHVPRRTPSVLRVPLRVSPMLFGVGKGAVIVCPDILWKSFSEEERHSFLAHETAHYCRRDHWIRWLEWITTAAYWWFPAVYVARRQLERHEEACCDLWAVRQLKTLPRQYAEALLKAVDFVSERQTGIPRLASGMRQTDCLEERLRFVMLGTNRKSEGSPVRWLVRLTCVTLLLLHPIAQPRSVSDVAVVKITRQVDSSTDARLQAADGFPESASDESSGSEADLPARPAGFWNWRPQRSWADFSLSMAGASVTAEAGRGTRIQLESGESITFSSDELRAIVDISSSRRIVIGSGDGNVRLWDLNSGQPVSLIGRHRREVTSMAYSAGAGLVSADAGGSVMRWDLQSGQVLTSMSVSASSVQCIRYSEDGEELCILTGLWDESSSQSLYVVDSRTLETRRTIPLVFSAAAIVPQQGRWLMVDWAGTVRDAETNVVFGRIPKERVSALVLTQNQAVSVSVDDVSTESNASLPAD